MNDLDVAIEANEKPQSFISPDHLGHVSYFVSLGATLLESIREKQNSVIAQAIAARKPLYLPLKMILNDLYI